jgi:hypothetical protein
MAGVDLIDRKGVVDQQVGDSLDRLTRNPSPPSDLSDGGMLILDRAEDDLPGQRLAANPRQRLTCGGDEPDERSDLDDELGERLAGRRPPLPHRSIDIMLSSGGA